MNIKYKIIKSKKRKRTTTIQISEFGKIMVRTPYNQTFKTTEKILINNKKWILQKLETLKKLNIKQKKYTNGSELLYRGKKILVKLENSKSTRTKINLAENNLIIKNGNTLKSNKIKEVITKWIKKEAKNIITNRVEYYTNFLNLKYKKIYIKNVKTIWGSCSSRKNLNFNYKLVMAPHNIIDYVVIHEVCHLVHQNHSKSFWSLVKSIDPNFKEHKKWLHENGHNLTL